MTAPRTAQRDADASTQRPGPTGEARAAAISGRRASAVGEDPHRLVRLEGRQDQRPAEPGRHAAARPVGVDGRARRATIACSTDETCSMRRRTGVVGRSRPGRGPAASAAVPTDSRGTTTRPDVERRVVDARSRRGPRGSRTATRSRRSSNVAQRRTASELRGGSGGRRAGGGRRPRTRPRRRSGRGPGRSAAARRRAPAPRRR